MIASAQQPVKTEKIYPNDPCPYGSGKKYKKCCMNKAADKKEELTMAADRKKWLEVILKIPAAGLRARST